MSERVAFISACLNRRERIIEICHRFGISEKTGHKLLARVKADGVAGLAERSHAPQTVPHRLVPDVVTRIVALRRKYPLYGPVKLRDWLMQQEPTGTWPAASTIGDVIKRAGLVRVSRRQRQVARAVVATRTAATAPNAVWTADFKGEFRLGGAGPYCYPLTVLDLYSHFLLGCRALESTAVVSTRHAFVRLFRAYGLPTVLRTDNGVPFAQHNALGRLGTLGFWWVRLGIRPEHITPARPAENGAHERFHKTLTAATTRPAAPSVRAQQARFDQFQQEYNTERPHASLPAHQPPGSQYTASLRPYPARLPTIAYADGADVRLVGLGGEIKWRNHALFLSTNLAGQYVGLTESDAELVTIAYASLALGDWDPYTRRFIPHVRWLT